MQSCAARSLPYGLLVHGAGERCWPDDAGIALRCEGFTHAKVCWFVSRKNQQLVERQLALPLPNARIVRNPFQVAYNAAPPWPPEEQGMRIACVAALDPAIKGQDLLLEVLRHDRWKQRPLHLSLFGAGHNRASLQTLARRYDLANVTFHGFVHDIEQIWADHHLLIHPSRHDGLPIAIVEAMLCGRPCLVTDIAGNAELLEDNVSGFVAPYPAVSALDEALERAWNRRADWQAMGRAAALRARELVPPDPVERFVQEILALLQ
jgi:glycosyltransferase involved in cell wall biosynthesis